MALSKKAQIRLEQALANKAVDSAEVKEVIDAINAGANPVAATIAALGTTTNIPVSNVTLSTSDTYTDAAVKTAIDSAVNANRTAAEARLDAIEAKIDALIAALKAAGLMAS